jgi:hypothetical protein
MTYRCGTCGKRHDGLPDVGSDRPLPWYEIPKDERESRAVATPDTCIIDNEHFFIRGVVEIPLVGKPDRFGFGVWVSQKRENFERYRNEPESTEIRPSFGWLCTRIAFYSRDTYLLKTKAHFRAGGLRPAIELEPTDHPLAVDQREGITLDKAWDIVHFYERRS